MNDAIALLALSQLVCLGAMVYLYSAGLTELRAARHDGSGGAPGTRCCR